MSSFDLTCPNSIKHCPEMDSLTLLEENLPTQAISFNLRGYM